MTNNLPLLFEDKPIFGLDIGHASARVMQLAPGRGKPKVVGYGMTLFDPAAIENGVIVKPEIIAEAIQKLFKHALVGDITTNRVALTVPVARAFTRSIDAPPLSEKELAEVVKTEVDQYIPAAAESLYIDYFQSTDKGNKSTVFVVAMPRKIVDSYITLTQLLGLEVVLIDTSSGSGANMFRCDAQSDMPTVLVDFGSGSADITIYDRNPIVSGTAPCGGEQITELIAKALDVSEREALIIKSRYGLTASKKQARIEAALKPTLSLLTKEIRRNIRYYDDRNKPKRSIAQIVVMGGGANMPGLSDYLTSDLRVPVRSLDPTLYLDFGKLQPLNAGERMSYVTVSGLSLYDPAKVFNV